MRIPITGVALATLFATGPVTAGSLTLSTGRAEPDNNGFDPATTAELRYGVEFLDVAFAEFDAEVSAATDIDPGETADGREFGFDSLGAAVSARTAGPVYLLGRYGLARNRLDIDGGPDSTETQQSIGVGIGASAGVAQFEVMATHFPEEGDIADITWLTVGVRF